MRYPMTAALSLLLAATVFLPSAFARRHAATRSGSDAYCKSSIVKRWRKLGVSRRASQRCSDSGPKDRRFHRQMLRLRPNFFTSKFAGRIFEGQKNKTELQYYVDALVTTRLSGGHLWFPMFWIDSRRSATKRAPLALYLYKHNNAAKLIAKAIATPKHVALGFGKAKPTAWWSLWYLGAKQHVDTIIGGFRAVGLRNRALTRHTSFMLSVLDRWKLSSAQKAKVEKFCRDHVLKPGASHRGAALGCMRYLGRIQTRDKGLQKAIMSFIGARATLGSMEAIRALSHIRYKGFKKRAKANLKSAKHTFVKIKRRGRRIKRSTYKGYTAHHDAVPSAVALVGLGDRKALRIIKSWLMTYDMQGFIHQETAFHAVFQETAFAHPKAIKKIKPLLRRALKKARKKARKNDRMKRVVLFASLAMLQMGDKSGLKVVLKAIKNAKRKRLYYITNYLGGTPSNTYTAWGSGSGMGHVKVGKKAIRIRDAKKIIKALTKRFKTIPIKKTNTRSYLLQAIADIQANILVAKNKL